MNENTQQHDENPADGRSGSNGELANYPLFDFRPRAVCVSSFIYGMLTGCGIAFGSYGAMHLDGVTICAAFFFLLFAKLAHEHIRLDNGEVRSASRPAGEASSREAATSTVVLGTVRPGKELK